MLKITYLLINLFSVLIPLILSFDKRLKFYKNIKAISLAIFLVAVPFIIWDVFFTQLGVWGFTDKYLIGFKVLNLPIEEILFFICIPYACIFSYEVIKYFFKDQVSDYIVSVTTNCLIILSFTILIFNLGKFYSSWTFALFAASLIYLRNKKFLGKFYISCLFILPAFILVNGLLTGIAFEEPVVWYNDSENLGLRFFSIPYDDFFYGFILLVWNVYLYEKFKSTHTY